MDIKGAKAFADALKENKSLRRIELCNFIHRI